MSAEHSLPSTPVAGVPAVWTARLAHSAHEVGGRFLPRIRARSTGVALIVGLGCALVSLLSGPDAMAADACSNAELRGGPSAHLADCRAYEQVSPVDKNGGEVAITSLGGPPGSAATRSQIWAASEDGDSVAYVSLAAFAGARSNLPFNTYRAQRGAQGWASAAIGAPLAPNSQNITNLTVYNQYFAYSPDLKHGFLLHNAPNGPLLDDGAILGYPNIYLRNLENDASTAITVAAPPGFPAQVGPFLSYIPLYRGASDDFSHAIFKASDQLTPDAPSTCYGTGTNMGCLYEWADGRLRLVSVLPDGTPAPWSDAGGPGTVYQGARNSTHAISADGSKIYWTAGDTDNFISEGDIYVRIDGSTTVPVGSGRFLAADEDGGRALYVGEDGHLYLFDLGSYDEAAPSAASTDLFPEGTAGYVGAADDLSYIYYLTEEGDLYLHRSGTGDGDDRLVAHLPPNLEHPVRYRIDDVNPLWRDSYVTPNGHALAFGSNLSLTGYDSAPAHPGDCGEGELQCMEVFHYDAEADQLSCASCNPSGDAPRGSSLIQRAFSDSYAPRVLSDDGGHLFFNSRDALVPGDTNGQQDVYEWRPDGSGDCGRADGCINLISGGSDGVPDPEGQTVSLNTFVDASADGDDVFFTTQERLVPSDPGVDADLYVAREGGGLESQHEVAAPPCAGDACQGDPTAPPTSIPSGSGSFVGGGNSVFAIKRPRRGKGAAVRLRLQVGGAGRVKVAGSRLRSRAKSVRRAGTYSLRAALTRKAERRLNRSKRGRLRVGARVSYRRKEGERVKRRISITFKQRAHVKPSRRAK